MHPSHVWCNVCVTCAVGEIAIVPGFWAYQVPLFWGCDGVHCGALAPLIFQCARFCLRVFVCSFSAPLAPRSSLSPPSPVILCRCTTRFYLFCVSACLGVAVWSLSLSVCAAAHPLINAGRISGACAIAQGCGDAPNTDFSCLRLIWS